MATQRRDRDDCDGPEETPEWAKQLLHGVARLHKQMEKLMSDQTKLDSDVAALTAGLDAVEKEIADLKAQPPAAALDFTKLDAAVARLQSDSPAPTPAPAPAPAPGPAPASAAHKR